MSRLNLILLFSTLTLALPGWAEADQKKRAGAQARPLNLSLPRDAVLQPPENKQVDETVLQNLKAPDPTRNSNKTSVRPNNLPYGAGYEHRHQEMGASGGYAGQNAGASGSAGHGAGRQGR